MFLFILSLISASAEFPICTAAGNQERPDICWDGEQFLVVWSDGRDGLSDIYATNVQETEESGEPFLFFSDTLAITTPHIDFSSDTVLLTFWLDSPLFIYGFMGYILLTPNGSPYWNSRKSIYEGYGPIVPVRCRDHFALLYTYGYDAQYEYPTWSKVALLDKGQLKTILEIPSSPGINPPTSGIGHGVWNGERLFCSTSAGYIWLEDTLDQDPDQNGFFYPRDNAYYWNELAMAAMDERIGMVGHCGINGNNYYFDLLNAEGTPINENPVFLSFKGLSSWFRPTSMDYGNGRFVSVSEARQGGYPNYTYTLWGAEIDSNIVLLNEGFLMAGPAQEKQPAVCFGQNHFLLVWADNRNGDWDIYGRILDSLEYSGIDEPATPPATHPPTITVDQTVFTDVLKINLSPATAGGTVLIHDALGRMVRRIEVKGRSCSCVWDGRDSRGDDAGEGVYFVSLAGKTRSARLKVIKIK